MTAIETGIDWDRVREDLDREEWQWNEWNDQFERAICIGSVFSLMPSGKYYTPWACSNVTPCPHCQGRSKVETTNKRLLKKWRKAVARTHVRAAEFNLAGNLKKLEKHGWFRYYRNARTLLTRYDKTCSYCNGVGSREAYLDELYSDKLNAEADERKLCVTSGEGDPCDIFVGECRDKCDDDDLIIEE
jgi:hypothetical protein